MDNHAINTKIRLGELLVGMLANDPDPRAPKVAEILQGQIAELRAQLADCEPVAEEKQGDSGKPPAQVVGLSALRLKARRL